MTGPQPTPGWSPAPPVDWLTQNRLWLKYLSPQGRARLAELSRLTLGTPQPADATGTGQPAPAQPALDIRGTGAAATFPVAPGLGQGPPPPTAVEQARQTRQQRQDVSDANAIIARQHQFPVLAVGKEAATVASGLITPAAEAVGLEPFWNKYLRREQALEEQGLLTPGRGLPTEEQQAVGSLLPQVPFFEAGGEATGPIAEALGRRLAGSIPGRALSTVAQTGLTLGPGAGLAATTEAMGRGASAPEAVRSGVEAVGQTLYPKTPLGAAFLAGPAAIGLLAEVAGRIAEHAQTQGAAPRVTSELDNLAREASQLSLIKTHTPAQLERLRNIGMRIQDLAQDLPPGPPVEESAAGPKARGGIERRGYQGRRIEDELNLLDQAMAHFQTGGPLATREAIEAISERASRLRNVLSERAELQQHVGLEPRRTTSPTEGQLPGPILEELARHARGADVRPGPFSAARLRRQGLPRAEQGQPLASPLAPQTPEEPAAPPLKPEAPPPPTGLPPGLKLILAGGAGAGAGAALAPPGERKKGALLGAAALVGMPEGEGLPGARSPKEALPDVGAFRSRLFTSLDTAPFKKGTGAQWLAHLSKGTKLAELQETGIADWLAAHHQQPVSRDDVRAAILPLTVTEHVFGDPGPARQAQYAAAVTARNQAAQDLLAAEQGLIQTVETPAGRQLLNRWRERLENGEPVAAVLPADAPPDLVARAQRYATAHQARLDAGTVMDALEHKRPAYATAGYQEPGGTDYSEIVLGAPIPAKAPEPLKPQDRADLVSAFIEHGYAPDAAEEWVARAERDEGIASQRVYELTGQRIPRGRQEAWYSPKHYGQVENQVAWTRLTTRDIGGVQGRFEEEFQSDVHEIGRDEGYRQSPAAIAEAKRAERAARDARDALNQRHGDELTPLMALGPEATQKAEVAGRPELTQVPVTVSGVRIGEFRRFGNQVWEWVGEGSVPDWYTDRTDLQDAFEALRGRFHDRDAWRHRVLVVVSQAQPGHPLPERHMAEMAAANDALQKASDARQAASGGVPKLPFSDTKAWLGLLFRRTLADAVSRSLKRVGWTTGKMQAKRWSKAVQEHVDQVEWLPTNARLNYYRNGQEVKVDDKARSAADHADLQNILGKDIADQLVANAAASATGIGRVTGTDLTVGANFFRLIYDKLKVQAVKDDLRRLGLKNLEPKLTGPGEGVEQPAVLTAHRLHDLAREQRGEVRDFLDEVVNRFQREAPEAEIGQDELDDAFEEVRQQFEDEAYRHARDNYEPDIPDLDEFRDGARDYVYEEWGSPTDTALRELRDRLKQETLSLFPEQGQEPIAPTVAHLRTYIEDELPRYSNVRDVLEKIIDKLDEDQLTSWKEIEEVKDEVLEEYVDQQAESDRDSYEPPEPDDQEFVDRAQHETEQIEAPARRAVEALSGAATKKEPVWYVDITPELEAKVRSGEATYLYGGLPLDPRLLKKLPPWALGAAVGAGVGAAVDEKHRLRGALLGGLAGAGLGKFARYLKKKPVGEAGAAAVQPVAPEAPVAQPMRPLQLVQPGPEGEPPPEFDAEQYVRVGKFPVALQPEVRRAVYNAVQQQQLPERPLTTEPSEARRGTSEALIARDVATGHFQEVDRLSQELQRPGLTDAQVQQLWDEIGTHRTKAQQLTSFWVKAGTETARELAARKLLAQASGDPFTWYVEAQRKLGPKLPLTDEVRSRIQGYIKEGDVVGLHHYIATLPQPGGFFQFMSDFIVGNIVSGPQVFLKALGGGMLFSALEHATDKVAAAGDALFSAATGAERSTLAWKRGMVRASLKGAVQGFKNGWAQLRGKPVQDPFLKAHPELAAEFAAHERHYQNPIYEWGAKLFTRPVLRSHGLYFNVLSRAAMERAGLEMAHVLATNAHLKGADYVGRVKELMQQPTDEMALHMLEAGQYASLRNRGLLARIGAQVKQAARTDSPLAGFIATEAIPITGVPANALARVLEYSGGGLLLGAADLTRLVSESLAEASVGPARGFKGRELGRLEIRNRMLKRLARGVMGPSGLVVLGYQLAKHGLMTGAFPDDPAEKRAWQLQGKTPYSLKLKKRWRNVASLIPVGPVVAIGAGLYDIFHRTYTGRGELATKGAKVAQAAMLPGRLIAEQPFLMQPKEIAATLSGEGTSASKIASGVAGSLIPYSAAARQVARGLDPYRRQATGPLEQVTQNIPGLSQRLPPQVDPFGRKVTQATGLEGVLDPTRPQPDLSQDPVRAELGRVRWGPTKLRQLPDEAPQAFVQRQAVWGAQLRNVLAQVVNSDEYQTLRSAEVAGQREGGNVGAYHAEVARQQELELLTRVSSAVRSAQMRALKAEAR